MTQVNTGQLRALSVSIQVSDRTKCTAGCEACISRLTPGDDPVCGDVRLCSMRRLKVGLGFAERAQATHAILTGRADPTQENTDYLCKVIRMAREHVPLVDMHTNGYLMQPGMSKEGLISELADAGLTMITFSLASFDDGVNRSFMHIKHSPADLIQDAVREELLVRCSLLVTKATVPNWDAVYDYIIHAGDHGVDQVVVREVWIPDALAVGANSKVLAWNTANKVNIGPIADECLRIATDRQLSKHFRIRRLDPLPWGAEVFAIGKGLFSDREHEVNVTFARCDDGSTGTVIKSIVHDPKGRGRRSWASKGDILY